MLPMDAPPPEPGLPPLEVRSGTLSDESTLEPVLRVVIPAARAREWGPGLQLSESLVSVPGVVALDRRNAAQDLQLSVRGHGSRATFGVRGVRLLEDGIPLTQPDGQGQTSGFELGAVQRIEVMKGAASVLEGHAPGGVVQVFSPDAPDRPEAQVSGLLGADGLWRLAADVGAQVGAVDVVARASWQGVKGWRGHSAAQREHWRARLKWRPETDREWLTVVSSVRVPEAQDPLGLTAEQLAQDPRQAGRNARLYDARKHIEQRQWGLVHSWRTGASSWRLMAHGGLREVTQFQAIPAPPDSSLQTLPGHPGGVIDLARRFVGGDTRWRWQGELADRPLTVTAGWAFEALREHRRGYQNFDEVDGVRRLGVQGALRRDEDNLARNAAPSLKLSWALLPDWVAELGLRHSRVSFASHDRYIAPGNGDDSGSRVFRATTSVLGLSRSVGPTIRVHGRVSRSFETPTLNELAYASVSGSQTGWNRTLGAARGTQVELGGLWSSGAGQSLGLTWFRDRVSDEIGVTENAGGRSVFGNVGDTERQGVELSGHVRLAPAWRARLAAAWTQAEYLDAFASSQGWVQAGRALPGVPRRTAWAELVWRPPASGWHSALSWRHVGRIWANDVNDAHAPAAGTWSWRAGWRQQSAGWRFDTTLWVDNLTDRRTVGSVIVNEASRRYFEPAPGRSATLSASLTRVF